VTTSSTAGNRVGRLPSIAQMTTWVSSSSFT
jgi:hypothetical protein